MQILRWPPSYLLSWRRAVQFRVTFCFYRAAAKFLLQCRACSPQRAYDDFSSSRLMSCRRTARMINYFITVTLTILIVLYRFHQNDDYIASIDSTFAEVTLNRLPLRNVP